MWCNGKKINLRELYFHLSEQNKLYSPVLYGKLVFVTTVGIIMSPILLFWISIKGDIEVALNFPHIFSPGFQVLFFFPLKELICWEFLHVHAWQCCYGLSSLPHSLPCPPGGAREGVGSAFFGSYIIWYYMGSWRPLIISSQKTLNVLFYLSKNKL